MSDRIDIVNNNKMFRLLRHNEDVEVFKQNIKEMLYKKDDNIVSIILQGGTKTDLYLDYITSGGVPFNTLDDMWSWLQTNLTNTTDISVVTNLGVIVVNNTLTVTHI